MNEMLEIERKEKELAPRIDFNNTDNGLNEKVNYVGERDRKGRDGDIDDNAEGERKDEDHEKIISLQEEITADDKDDSW